MIRKKVLSELNVIGYKTIVEKLCPKLNTFIDGTKT